MKDNKEVLQVLIAQRDKYLGLANKVSEAIKLISEVDDKLLITERVKPPKQLRKTRLIVDKKYAASVRKDILTILDTNLNKVFSPKDMVKEIKKYGHKLSLRQITNMLYNMHLSALIIRTEAGRYKHMENKISEKKKE